MEPSRNAHDEFFACRIPETLLYLNHGIIEQSQIKCFYMNNDCNYCYICKNLNQLICICAVGSPNVKYIKSKGTTVSRCICVHFFKGRFGIFSLPSISHVTICKGQCCTMLKTMDKYCSCDTWIQIHEVKLKKFQFYTHNSGKF